MVCVEEVGCFFVLLGGTFPLVWLWGWEWDWTGLEWVERHWYEVTFYPFLFLLRVRCG